MSSAPGAGALDAEDDFDAPAARGAEQKVAPALNFDKPQQEKPQEPAPRDATAVLEEILSGGQEYRTDEEIEQLPQELQPVVRAFLVLEQMQPIQLAALVSEESRGVVYPIQKEC